MPKVVFGCYVPPDVDPPDALRITTNGIPNAVQNELYLVQLGSEGGVLPYTWSLIAPDNSLPTGMTFAPDGTLSGRPTVSGTFPLNFRVTDNVGATVNTGVFNFQVAAAGAFTVTTVTMPSVVRGNSYVFDLQKSGGVGAVTWSMVSPNNTLPTGLTLTSATGRVQGTPTVAQSVQVKFRATDSLGNTADSGLITITVNQVAALSIVTQANLPNGTNGSSYNRTFTTSGGWAPVTWTKLSGDFPAGLSFNGTTGTLSGTLTTEATYLFTLRATDSEGRTADKAFTIVVQASSGAEGPHDFFDENKVRAEVVAHFSLRDQAQVNARVSTPAGIAMNTWVYNPGADVYPRAKDACRLTMNHSLGSSNQLDFPMTGYGSDNGKFLIITDFWWGREFKENLVVGGEPLQHKFMQMRDQGGKGSGQSIYCEEQCLYLPNATAPVIARRQLRAYEMGNMMTEWGVLGTEQYNPSGKFGYTPAGQYQERYERWTRDWHEYQMRVPGTDFTEWCETFAPGSTYPLGTRNIVSTATDGAGGCIITLDTAMTYTRGANPPVTHNLWSDYITSYNGGTPGGTVTIAGHSNTALNGTHYATVVDLTHIRIAVDVGATTGSGGTASKNFMMYTWIHATETEEPFYIYYKVPLLLRSTGKLAAFDYELNTSKDVTVLKGWAITTPIVAGNPVSITTPEPHGMATNDFIAWNNPSGISPTPLPAGAYQITVTGPDTLTLPVNVTQDLPQQAPARPQIQRLNFGDIGTGDSFILRWDGDDSPVITYSSDMSSAIFNACDLQFGFSATTAQVTKIADNIYDVALVSSKSNLLQINSQVGFTAGGVTRTQTYVANSIFAGSYGRVTKALVGYTRNLIIMKNYDLPHLQDGDSTIFRKPVDG